MSYPFSLKNSTVDDLDRCTLAKETRIPENAIALRALDRGGLVHGDGAFIVNDTKGGCAFESTIEPDQWTRRRPAAGSRSTGFPTSALLEAVLARLADVICRGETLRELHGLGGISGGECPEIPITRAQPTADGVWILSERHLELFVPWAELRG